KGEQYVPSKVHHAIRWKNNDPFHLSNGAEINWKIVDTSKSACAIRPKIIGTSRFVPKRSTQSDMPELVKK
ncbi:hypothetical protein BYT27DRAFT_7017717, partial [Phlegmacium glaucopus]